MPPDVVLSVSPLLSLAQPLYRALVLAHITLSSFRCVSAVSQLILLVHVFIRSRTACSVVYHLSPLARLVTSVGTPLGSSSMVL